MELRAEGGEQRAKSQKQRAEGLVHRANNCNMFYNMCKESDLS
jgi:hypothetical protein